jgi:gas vesicle protein
VKDDIIKILVDMDFNARQKVEELQAEKDNLDSFLKTSRKQLLKQYTQDTSGKIQDTINEINEDLKKKTIQITAEHEKILEQINRIFKEKKDEWIEDMFNYCIK